jgi:Asp-tRNA(Asn)/Glu-tRNA(Gln) amidotransferase A subunit family amidase
VTGSFALYIEAKQLADECRRRLDALLGDIDVLLTPAAFGEAPIGMAGFAGVPLFQLWSTLHVPALCIPVFTGPAGLPIGAQLIAKRHDDRKLFACAEWAYSKLT